MVNDCTHQHKNSANLNNKKNFTKNACLFPLIVLHYMKFSQWNRKHGQKQFPCPLPVPDRSVCNDLHKKYIPYSDYVGAADFS